DEARTLLDRYNKSIASKAVDPRQAYDELVNELFGLYSTRAHQPIEEPWFAINGIYQSLEDFVNEEGYYQPALHPSNQWMTVGRLRPETVQNPMMKGKLTRELWWNRKSGIHPIGSTRISRNFKTAADGTEEIVSVEVLHRGEDGIFVPYTFEPDAVGRLRLASGVGARKASLSCFECHVRLKGIFFGGITIPNYQPSPDWYINWIDRIMWKYHRKFEGLRK
ncbi:MAG: hypothetical protein ACXWPM_06555, partial [Bdellovibrionota bacterium]